MRLFLAAGILFASTAVQPATSYRVVTSTGVQSLPVHTTNGTVELVTLDAVARLFGLMVRDDARAGGAVVASGADRIIITGGQATASVNGRVISVSAPITRSGNTWLVPVDFLRALGRGIDVRRATRLIVVPPAVVPTVTPRFERTAGGGRLTLTFEPATTTRTTREGNEVLVRTQASIIDLVPLTGAPDDFVRDVRIADTSVVIELGPAVVNVRTDTDDAAAPVVLDLLTPAPPTTPTAAPPPSFERADPGLRTIVIDPGHGGDDAGTRHGSGATEKDITLAMARRLKTILEQRFGLRVLLTRDDDRHIDLDRRAAVANNNKADVFISLHVNASPVAAVRGAQVLSLDPDLYAQVDGAADAAQPATPLTVIGGGSRNIDLVPWHLAQLPRAAASMTLAQVVARRLTDAGIAMHPRPISQGPWRALVSANMPAVIVELGLLSHEDEARLLTDGAHQSALAEALAAAIGDVRTGIVAQAGGGQ